MTVLETPRLRLRELHAGDAAFALELVNEPAWLRYIGDKRVHTLDEARAFLEKGWMASYPRHGFGFWLMELAGTGEPVGVCGLTRRDELEAPDLGFAVVARHRGKGFAHEAAAASLAKGHGELGLPRILAIAQPDNGPSIALLEKLGFALAGRRTLWDTELVVYAHEA